MKNDTQYICYTMEDETRVAFEQIANFLDINSLRALTRTNKTLRNIAYRQIFNADRNDDNSIKAQKHLLSLWIHDTSFIYADKHYWNNVLKHRYLNTNISGNYSSLITNCLWRLNQNNNDLLTRALCLTLLGNAKSDYSSLIMLLPILHQLGQHELINNIVSLCFNTLKSTARRDASDNVARQMRLVYPYIETKMIQRELFELAKEKNINVSPCFLEMIVDYMDANTCSQFITPLIVLLKNASSNIDKNHLMLRKMHKILPLTIPLLTKKNIYWLLNFIDHWLHDKDDNSRAYGASIINLFKDCDIAKERCEQLALSLLSDIINAGDYLQENIVITLSYLSPFFNNNSCEKLIEYINIQPDEIYKEIPEKAIVHLIHSIGPRLNTTLCEKWALYLFTLNSTTQDNSIKHNAAVLLSAILETFNDKKFNALIIKFFTDTTSIPFNSTTDAINILHKFSGRINITTCRKLLSIFKQLKYINNDNQSFQRSLIRLLGKMISHADMGTVEQIGRLLFNKMKSVRDRYKLQLITNTLQLLYPVLDEINSRSFRTFLIEHLSNSKTINRDIWTYIPPVLALIIPSCNANECEKLLSIIISAMKHPRNYYKCNAINCLSLIYPLLDEAHRVSLSEEVIEFLYAPKYTTLNPWENIENVIRLIIHYCNIEMRNQLLLAFSSGLEDEKIQIQINVMKSVKAVAWHKANQESFANLLLPSIVKLTKKLLTSSEHDHVAEGISMFPYLDNDTRNSLLPFIYNYFYDESIKINGKVIDAIVSFHVYFDLDLLTKITLRHFKDDLKTQFPSVKRTKQTILPFVESMLTQKKQTKLNEYSFFANAVLTQKQDQPNAAETNNSDCTKQPSLKIVFDNTSKWP